MTGHPPSPLAAAVGLVATAADGLRRLPHALGTAGQAAARRYDELAARGQELLAPRPPEGAAPDRGQQVEPDELAARPPEGAAPDRGQEVEPDEAAAAGQDVVAGGVPDAAAGRPEVVAEPPIGRTEPVLLPDDVQEDVAQIAAGADLAHDELPLADFDHQTVPQLRSRLRTLGLAELVQLRDYEQAHAARVPVLTLLDNRIAKLLADTDR